MKDMTHQFLDWLRSKPADETYDFYQPNSCALAQFVNGTYAGVRATMAGGFLTAAGETIEYPKPAITAVNGVEKHGEPWTFGAAADRLEKLLQP